MSASSHSCGAKVYMYRMCTCTYIIFPTTDIYIISSHGYIRIEVWRTLELWYIHVREYILFWNLSWWVPNCAHVFVFQHSYSYRLIVLILHSSQTVEMSMLIHAYTQMTVGTKRISGCYCCHFSPSPKTQPCHRCAVHISSLYLHQQALQAMIFAARICGKSSDNAVSLAIVHLQLCQL